MPAQPEFQRRLQSIEQLLGKIEGAADPSLRSTVQELVQLVMDLHGAGFERILELIRASGDGSERIIAKLERDELVSSLLVFYGLHPLDLEARVGLALEKARNRLRPHGGEVELLSIRDGEVRLRLEANGHGCGSTAEALQEIVEEAVYQEAPDVTALLIEGAGEKQGFVSLEMLRASVPATNASNGHAPASNGEGGL